MTLKLLHWIPKKFLTSYHLPEIPAAIDHLRVSQDEIKWYYLSENPAAVHWLEMNQDKIDWDSLSLNPAAIHLLEANQDRIEWMIISQNTAIFAYDYYTMAAERSSIIIDELLSIALRPERVAQWREQGFDIQYC